MTSSAFAIAAPRETRLALSAFIICKDEADGIGACLASLAQCAEIVVVDSGSTDGTLAIVEAMRASGWPIRLHHQKWLGYAGQKQFALERTTQPWALNIDGDERLDAALQAALPGLIAAGPEVAGWRLARPCQPLLGYGPVPAACYAKPILRLVRRTQARFDLAQLVHERIILEGRTRDAPCGRLIHERALAVIPQLRKEVGYAGLKARQRRERGQGPSALRLVLNPTVMFTRMFLLNRMFLAGRAGFIHARTAGAYAFLVEAFQFRPDLAGVLTAMLDEAEPAAACGASGPSLARLVFAPPAAFWRALGGGRGVINAKLASVRAFAIEATRLQAAQAAGGAGGRMTRLSLRDVCVVAPNLHWRYSGVTSTIAALVPHQARTLAVATIGPFMPPDAPHVSAWSLLREGWTRPAGRMHRIWHARRNDEMIVGVLLRDVLRQPWRLVFTSAAQRRHSHFTRALLARMDAVIATTPGAAAVLDRPATLIPHGVDTTLYHPAPDRAAARRALGIEGDFVIGAFGRLRPQKGTDVFIEAMIRLLPRYPGACAVLTGLATPEHEAFVAALRGKIRAAGLAPCITFAGERPRAEMPAWFAAIDLYVAPMRHEGYGLTPIEAMACSAAVVATRTGAAPALVEDGVTGLLVPPDDLDALTTAIEAMLADPARARRMGEAGRAKAVAQHDILREAEAIAQVYAAVWRGASAPAGLKP